MNNNNALTIAIAAGLIGAIHSTQGALLFHEPFDYTDGAILNDANAIGGWSDDPNSTYDGTSPATVSNTGAAMQVHDGDGGNGESWDGVFSSGAGGLTVGQSGGYAGAFTGSDHLFGTISLGSSVTSAFTNGSTTWFSFIGYKQNGRHALAAIGAGPTTGDRSRGSVDPNIGMGGRYNGGDSMAHTWAGGAQYANGPSAGNATEMFFIAKIEWAAGGSNDTITMAAFADGATITEAAFNAATQSVLTADFDQSTFDTLNVGNQRHYIDEIRIATTFEDAVTGVIPEPSSAALLGLAGLALTLRRRR